MTKINDELIVKSQAIRKELETAILLKLGQIKEKILIHSYKTIGEEIQTLSIVHDDLDDVLLNWEISSISIFPTQLDDIDED
jgi:hypothetical protein